jgi:hypothetical protein
LVRTIWCEKWQSTEQRLAELEAILRRLGAVAERGGHFDSWDLNIRGGLVGSVRALAMVEEHGGGKQLFRVRAWTTVSMLGFLIPVSFTVLAIFAALDDAWVAASVASVGALALALSAYADCATAMKMWSQVVEEYASSGR